VSIVELPVESQRWLDFVSGRVEALPFHHPSWALLLEECYGFRSFALALEDEPGRLVAGVPVLEVRRPLGRARWISLPFTDLCPPLVEAARTEQLAAELDAARQAKDVSQLEVRGPLLSSELSEPDPPLRHTLSLGPDPEAVASRFKSSVMRNIRKAERSGVTVRRDVEEADLTETFYRLHVETRRRLGVPVQPRRFFRLLWSRVVAPGHGFVLLAHEGARPIAASVFMAWNGTIAYKFGASDASRWELRPNDLLFWDAIQWGCASGFQTLDFGRTDAGAEGLRRFKLGWGCDEEPIRYTVLGASSGRLESSKSTALAPVLRHSPAWVTRAVGELLYKYAA